MRPTLIPIPLALRYLLKHLVMGFLDGIPARHYRLALFVLLDHAEFRRLVTHTLALACRRSLVIRHVGTHKLLEILKKCLRGTVKMLP